MSARDFTAELDRVLEAPGITNEQRLADPAVLEIVAEITAPLLKAVRTFPDYVQQIADQLGRTRTARLAPLLEQAWDRRARTWMVKPRECRTFHVLWRDCLVDGIPYEDSATTWYRLYANVPSIQRDGVCAPKGKFRMWSWNNAEEYDGGLREDTSRWVRDFDDRRAAVEQATRLTKKYRDRGLGETEATVYQVYDDQGRYIGGNPWKDERLAKETAKLPVPSWADVENDWDWNNPEALRWRAKFRAEAEAKSEAAEKQPLPSWADYKWEWDNPDFKRRFAEAEAQVAAAKPKLGASRRSRTTGRRRTQ